MVKYHITEDGPKKCVAKTKESCHVGGEHFLDPADATKAYDKKMSEERFKKVKKTPKLIVPDTPRLYAPAKTVFVEPTIDEIDEWRDHFLQLLHSRKNKGHNKTVSKEELLLKSNIKYIAVTGSIVYNLDTPSSDRDLVAVSDLDANLSHHYLDGMKDLKIFTEKNFHLTLNKASSPEVDMLHSGKMQLLDSNFSSFYRNFRFNPYMYLDNVRSMNNHAYNAGYIAFKDGDEKAMKKMKIGLRNNVIASRLMDSGKLHVVFSDDDRELFYRKIEESYDESLEMYSKFTDHGDKSAIFNAFEDYHHNMSKDFL